MNKYKASVTCNYTDDGEMIYVDFNYVDSNGVEVHSKKKGGDIERISASIVSDIAKEMIKAKAKNQEKPKKPEDMTKEELLEALKLLEKEANTQKTKNDMLEKRLQAQDKRKYANEIKIDRQSDLAKTYKDFLRLIDTLG